MSDSWTNPFSPLASIFWPGRDKDTPQSLRQKIALAMLSQKRPYPKTFGEGLAAIGDAIGDRSMMARIEAEAAGDERAVTDLAAKAGAPVGAGRSSYAPPDSVDEASRAINTAIEPRLTPQPVRPAPSPPTVVAPPPPQSGPAPGELDGQVTLQEPPVHGPGALNNEPGLPPNTYRLNGSGAPYEAWRQGTPAPAQIRPPVGPGVSAPPARPPGPQSALQPPPGTPVMAMGGEEPASASAAATLPPVSRDEIALAAMGPPAAGGPQPNPTRSPAGGANQRVAQAAPTPQISKAPAGYVLDLPPEEPPPRTTTDQLERYRAAILNAPGGVREGLAARLEIPMQMEMEKVKQAHELWKERQLLRRQLELKRQDQLGNQRPAQDAAEAADLARQKALEDLKKARIPEVKQDIDTGLTYNETTGQWEQPRIAGTDGARPVFKGTDAQNKALINYGRALPAHLDLSKQTASGETYEQVLASSPVQSAISSLPYGVGRGFRSEDYKAADTYAENFVQAFIRQQSGGAYTPSELEAEARGMLPRYGDTQQQIDFKRGQREQFLSGMASVVGPRGQKIVEMDMADRVARENAAKTQKPDPLDGREILMPDGSIKVRRNGKWVAK